MAQKILHSLGGDSSNESPSVDHHQASPNISKPQNLEFMGTKKSTGSRGRNGVFRSSSFWHDYWDALEIRSKMIDCSKSLEKSFGMNWAECHHFQPSKKLAAWAGPVPVNSFPKSPDFLISPVHPLSHIIMQENCTSPWTSQRYLVLPPQLTHHSGRHHFGDPGASRCLRLGRAAWTSRTKKEETKQTRWRRWWGWEWKRGVMIIAIDIDFHGLTMTTSTLS